MVVRNCVRCNRNFDSNHKCSRVCEKCKKSTIGYKKYDRPPEWLKRAYRRSVDYRCVICKEKEDKVGTLQPHRIKRGNDGGKYTTCRFDDPGNNVMMVCAKCHRKLHGNEFRHISGSN